MSGTVFELRASAAAIWVRCTAYRRMIEGKPDIRDPLPRDEGIAFHWAALMVWLGYTVNIGQGVCLDGMTQTVYVDDEMVDAIDEYLDRIRSRGGKPMLEYSVASPRIHLACGGTTDAWNWIPQTLTLYVDDAKYGRRFVDPYRNWQCITYVSGLLDHIGVIDDTKVTVVISIFQPRAFRAGGPWFEWRVNAAELRSYVNMLRNAAEEAMSDHPKCRTGPWCNECAGRLECDAFGEAVENALETAAEPINNELTPARADTELMRVQRAMEILEARNSALEARAEHFMRKGVQMKHFALESGNGRLAWKPEIMPALEAMAATQKVELFTKKPITPTQAKKVLDPAMVAALSDRPSGKLKIVRVDPDRAARVFEGK